LGEGPQLNRLRQKMGSADYRSAGALRPIFNRVVQEDLTNVAVQVHCPTVLIYGKEDTETPPEMGERLNRLIKGSELTVLDGFGHLSILNEGRHQLAVRIRRFLEARAR
jgi:pimeloyl-ACP methyl ester carboxylesterase